MIGLNLRFFTQNIRHTKDNTYHHLRHLRSNKDIVLQSGDKDSSVVIMNKVDYIEKVNGMINEGIQQGKYKMTTDTTHKDLEKFHSFLYRNFKSHPSCNCLSQWVYWTNLLEIEFIFSTHQEIATK